MKLQLKVKHFIEFEYKPLLGKLTSFSWPGCDCAIEKALKEQFNTPRVWESVNFCTVQSIEGGTMIYYKHNHYGINIFHRDQDIALKHQDDPEFLIRTLTLIKYEK